MKNRLFTLSLLLILTSVHFSYAQLAGTAGAFSRMGFGARGMSMGNAMTAVVHGDISGYYNPAVTAFMDHRAAGISFGALTNDRALNTLSYSQNLPPSAGLSVGLINAGVSSIDGRDNDGFHTENYSTSENQASLAFSLRPFAKLSFGVATKLYYYSLFEELSATSFSLDAGALYRITPEFSAGVSVRDLMAKYKWDTSKLYGQQGNSTTEKFPSLRTLGIAYADDNVVISVEYESSSEQTNRLRGGAEWTVVESFKLRTGIDRYDFSRSSMASPTFGFYLSRELFSLHPAIEYAYVIEPYGVSSMHIISLTMRL